MILMQIKDYDNYFINNMSEEELESYEPQTMEEEMYEDWFWDED